MNKRKNTLFDILMFILKIQSKKIDKGKCQTCVRKIIPYFLILFNREKPTHLRKTLVYMVKIVC